MIFHLDLDSFYVSAERLRRPELIGIPVAVGGRSVGSVLSSASYEARKYGIRSAMPSAQALRLYPALQIVSPDMRYYSTLSRSVFEVVSRFSPTIEKVSIDEAYLDMRGTTQLFGEPVQAAERIRREIREATGLAASIGIGSNRRIAKIASDFAKPDGVHFVDAGREREFLAPLEMRKIPGIGPSSEKSLNAEGIFRVQDLFAWSDERLESRFGESFGGFLARVREGQGSTEFFEEAKTRSMSREETFFPHLENLTQIQSALWELVTDLGQELRAEREGDAKVYGHTVRLKLRYGNFDTLTRAKTPERPTRVDREIYEIAESLLIQSWENRRPVRLLGVGVVLGEGTFQPNLFEGAGANRAEKIDELRDELRAKFGGAAARSGRELILDRPKK